MTVAVAAPDTVAAPWYSRLWAGLLVLLGLCVGVWYFFHIPAVAHWATDITGQDQEAGGHYGFYSGFGGSIQPGVIGVALVAYWHSSCHQRGCWMPGRHAVGDGSVKLCRWHHPDIRGRKVTTALIEELQALHHHRLHNAPAP